MPIASRTTVRWGNTAGFTGLVYRVIASSSCNEAKSDTPVDERDPQEYAKNKQTNKQKMCRFNTAAQRAKNAVKTAYRSKAREKH